MAGPKFKNGGHMAVGAEIRKPPFLETGELWSTYVDTFGKPSGRAISH